MTAVSAHARARAAGLTLTVAGGCLRWRGPEPAPDLLAELRAHKPELLALLMENEQSALAAALLAAAARGAAAVASGPVDDIEAAEAAAIRSEQTKGQNALEFQSATPRRQHDTVLTRAGDGT